jgi:hypothetical protein
MPAAPVNFLAVLVFAEQIPGRRTIEPHVYTASHPEIAYQLALKRAAEPRGGRRFVGLATLAQTFDPPTGIATSERGEAWKLVKRKEQLAAFHDPRWATVKCDPAELAEALREPATIVELDGLDAIDWGKLTHAYGPALDVPIDLRRLAGTDRKRRGAALGQLWASLCHQGTIYDATAAAVPFLVKIAAHPAFPERGDVLELLNEIALSAAMSESEVREVVELMQDDWDVARVEREVAKMLRIHVSVRAALAAPHHP